MIQEIATDIIVLTAAALGLLILGVIILILWQDT